MGMQVSRICTSQHPRACNSAPPNSQQPQQAPRQHICPGAYQANALFTFGSQNIKLGSTKESSWKPNCLYRSFNRSSSGATVKALPAFCAHVISFLSNARPEVMLSPLVASSTAGVVARKSRCNVSHSSPPLRNRSKSCPFLTTATAATLPKVEAVPAGKRDVNTVKPLRNLVARSSSASSTLLLRKPSHLCTICDAVSGVASSTKKVSASSTTCMPPRPCLTTRPRSGLLGAAGCAAVKAGSTCQGHIPESQSCDASKKPAATAPSLRVYSFD
mmetsp:Transcript_21994/g.48862  ORF Transcript_21994/g.48862 Transcript_21994/m.48862 type:complete len:274 (+) Transcript_21994:314-1135(+)